LEVREMLNLNQLKDTIREVEYRMEYITETAQEGLGRIRELQEAIRLGVTGERLELMGQYDFLMYLLSEIAIQTAWVDSNWSTFRKGALRDYINSTK
jgi:hypothetical protein